MSTTIRWRHHILILGVILTAGVLFRALYPQWYIADQRNVVAKAEMAQARSVEHYWGTFQYTTTDNAGFAACFLQKLDVTNIPLSTIQQTTLATRLNEMFIYFADPTVESYYWLMTHGVHYDFRPNPKADQVTAASNHVTQSPTDPKSFLQDLCMKNSSRKELLPITSISAVCLDHVLVNTSISNNLSALMKIKGGLGFTFGVEPLNPGFIYQTKDSTGVRAHQEVNLQINFLAKVKTSGNVGPVAVSLTWLPQDQNWAITHMIYDRWLNVSRLF